MLFNILTIFLYRNTFCTKKQYFSMEKFDYIEKKTEQFFEFV